MAIRRASAGEAPSHPTCRGHVDKSLQLVIQVLLGLIPMYQPAHDRREAMQERHGVPSFAAERYHRIDLRRTTSRRNGRDNRHEEHNERGQDCGHRRFHGQRDRRL
jgi:hypothetical protein